MGLCRASQAGQGLRVEGAAHSEGELEVSEGGSEGGKVGRRGLCGGRGQCRLGARM